MRTACRVAAFLFVAGIAAPLLAQPSFFGAPFPLTNTRYGAQTGRPLVRSNGTEPILFWEHDSTLLAARLVDGENRVGRPVFTPAADFDVIWTGAHFVLVTGNPLRAQVLGAHGDPIGQPISLLGPDANDELANPQLAFDGERVLLAYTSDGSLHTMLLDTNGAPVADSDREIATIPTSSRIDYAVASNGTSFAVLMLAQDQTEVVLVNAAGRIVSRHTLAMHQLSITSSRATALASDGHDYFAVWSELDRVDSAIVRGTGVVESVVALEQSAARIDWLAAVWSGTRFDVACTTGSTLRVLHVAPLSYDVTREESRPAREYAPVSATVVQGRLLVALGGGYLEPINTWDVTRDVEHSAYGADDQFKPAIATAAGVTLVAWQENGVHAGLRYPDGSWIEQQILPDEQLASVASDGTDFVVITMSNGLWKAHSFSHDGQLLASSEPREALMAPAIAWNGTHYGVLYYDRHHDLVVATMSRSGALLTPIAVLPQQKKYQKYALASDGTGFLIAGRIDTLECVNCFLLTSRFYAVRLDANMQRIDTPDLLLDTSYSSFSGGIGPALMWDGSHYGIAIADPEGIRLRTVSSSGTIGPPQPLSLAGPFSSMTIAPVAGGFGLLTSQYMTTTTFSLFRNATLVASKILDEQTQAAFAAMDGGRAAIVSAQQHMEAPYHSSWRVMMTVVDVAAATIPAPPRVQAQQTTDGSLLVRWTPTSKAPIRGYRLEYRIGDNEWKELEEWFTEGTTSVALTPPRRNTTYAFRVRALSDAGMSDPSSPATTYVGRRRAVR